MRYKDRKDAGIKLAEALVQYKGADAVVLALPRGGVEIGFEVSRILEVPLDLVVTKKVGHPSNPEYAICAVSENGPNICNENETRNINEGWLNAEIENVKKEIKRRKEKYQAGQVIENLEGKIAIIVDDGIATGLTMLAAIEDIKSRKPFKIVVAVPMAPVEIQNEIKRITDNLIVLEKDKAYLGSVGAYYEQFLQLSDDEVIIKIKESKKKKMV